MARFSPVRSQCQFDTPGERRFPERLEKQESHAAAPEQELNLSFLFAYRRCCRQRSNPIAGSGLDPTNIARIN